MVLPAELVRRGRGGSRAVESEVGPEPVARAVVAVPATFQLAVGVLGCGRQAAQEFGRK
jgi:hypothetical protein